MLNNDLLKPEVAAELASAVGGKVLARIEYDADDVLALHFADGSVVELSTLGGVELSAVRPAAAAAVPTIRREMVVSIEHQPGHTFFESSACEGFDWDEYRFGVRISTEGEDYPPELAPVVAMARSNGCNWIAFDAAGPEVAGLPKWTLRT